ncbi:MAG TPA: hypothetical protein VEB59_12635 [Gemmatimonadales bacterium]|nr:hypothetical protein [Gemmatimonadales bacterium]
MTATSEMIALPLGGEISLVIEGAPRTKKNHGEVLQMGTRKVHLPSRPFRFWESSARIRRPPGLVTPLTGRAYNVAALFYRDWLAGDAVGYYQGLADFLQARGIVRDDKVFVSWDGSRLLLDRERPRVELVLTPMPVTPR